MGFKSFVKQIIHFFVPERPLKEKPIIYAQKEEAVPEIKRRVEIQEKIVFPKVYPSKPSEKQIVGVKKPTNILTKNILGITFTFDKETYKKFEEDFSNERGWEISYDDKGCYLWRIKKNGYYEYFHRWLMQDEIDKFAKKHNLKTSDVIVHHKNHIHTENRMLNLGLMSRKEHDKYHKKEKAFQKWNGTRQAFEEWYWKNHKE
jgi:hypothetical protein